MHLKKTLSEIKKDYGSVKGNNILAAKLFPWTVFNMEYSRTRKPVSPLNLAHTVDFPLCFLDDINMNAK